MDKDFLLNGIRHGFKIVDIDCIKDVPVCVDNHRSAKAHHKRVEKHLLDELSNGNYRVTDTRPPTISAWVQ